MSYENIWIDPVAKTPQIIKPANNPETEVTTPPPVPPRLRSKQPSFLARSSNEDSAISSSASSSSNDVHVLSSNQNSPPQRHVWDIFSQYLWLVLMHNTWVIHTLFLPTKSNLYPKYYFWSKNDGENWSRKLYFEMVVLDTYSTCSDFKCFFK